MRRRSRHSRRTVPTKRSANAFARGAWTGVLMILTPSVWKTSSKPAVNFVARSRTTNLAARDRSIGPAQVAGLLGDPLPHRAGGDAGEVDPPGVDLNEEQHVEAPQKDSIDGEEVAGQVGA